MIYCCQYCTRLTNLRADQAKLTDALGIINGKYSQKIESVRSEYAGVIGNINATFGAACSTDAAEVLEEAELAKTNAVRAINARLENIAPEIAAVSNQRNAYHEARDAMNAGVS
jgi:hypothetical protein